MAVKYRLWQDNRKDSVHNGQWYARTAYEEDDIVTTDELADQIEAATTLTRADVAACIEAFLFYVKRGLLEGKRVQLRRLGTFKVGIHTTPANSVKKFTVAENIKGARVIFTPATTTTYDGNGRKRVKSLLAGVSFREKGFYDVNPPKGKEQNP